jgi:hypothetical protein
MVPYVDVNVAVLTVAVLADVPPEFTAAIW